VGPTLFIFDKNMQTPVPDSAPALQTHVNGVTALCQRENFKLEGRLLK
jgi:hypothetical protein